MARQGRDEHVQEGDEHQNVDDDDEFEVRSGLEHFERRKAENSTYIRMEHIIKFIFNFINSNQLIQTSFLSLTHIHILENELLIHP